MLVKAVDLFCGAGGASTGFTRACDDLGVDAIFLWPTDKSRPFYLRYGFGVRDDLMERRQPSSPWG